MRNGGFTLVELLVVVTILAVLVGMLMPVLGMANRSAKRTNTVAVMKKVENAVRAFHMEVGTRPYAGESSAQADDTDLVSGRANRLWHFLGTAMTTTQRDALKTDIDAVRSVFAYNLKHSSKPADWISESYNPINALAFHGSDISPGPAVYNELSDRYEAAGMNSGFDTNPSSDGNISQAAYLNRIATERYTLAVLAGNTFLKGWRSETVWDTAGRWPALGGRKLGRDNSSAALIVSTVPHPGWCDNYLAGEIESRFIDGEDVLDAYRKPIVYICPVISGVRSTTSWMFIRSSGGAYGLSDEVYGLGPQGRISRSQRHIRHPLGTAYVVPADPLASDRRFFAEPGRELEPEFWSAGSDGRFAARRNHEANADNIPLLPYDKDLVP